MEDAAAEPRKAYEEGLVSRTRSREAMCLDVRLKDGTMGGGPYAFLSWVEFTPGDKLVLHFPGRKVRIEGKNLRDLYARLLDHRVMAIQEGTEAEEGLKPDEAAHIDHIEVETEEEKEHGPRRSHGFVR